MEEAERNQQFNSFKVDVDLRICVITWLNLKYLKIIQGKRESTTTFAEVPIGTLSLVRKSNTWKFTVNIQA